MSNSKFKMTGFARFFIFMIIAAPTIFLGASYYNGEDGIQNLKNLIGIGEQTEEVANTQPEPKETSPSVKEEPKATPSQSRLEGQLKKAKDDLATRENRIDELYEENAELKKQLKEKEAELQNVTEQLKKIKSAIGN